MSGGDEREAPLSQPFYASKTERRSHAPYQTQYLLAPLSPSNFRTTRGQFPPKNWLLHYRRTS
ncbi:hypothetical protein E2C01_020034 [Portunus trituberculatus]|uniref:Uncharacterized protein n=1 Tax=Portunus trituberculatus TaxID=210409 RepID=A0A5B7E103_PORTR|nr:hypothetical protein [Portunus trituberculatus]